MTSIDEANGDAKAAEARARQIACSLVSNAATDGSSRTLADTAVAIIKMAEIKSTTIPRGTFGILYEEIRDGLVEPAAGALFVIIHARDAWIEAERELLRISGKASTEGQE